MTNGNASLGLDVLDDETTAATQRASEEQVNLQAKVGTILLIIAVAMVSAFWMLGVSKEELCALGSVFFALFAAGVLGLSPR